MAEQHCPRSAAHPRVNAVLGARLHPGTTAAVTTTMIAVTPSMRRFVGMSLASSINLPRGERSLLQRRRRPRN